MTISGTPEGKLDIDARSFDEFRQLIYGRCGIVLQPGKEALVGARVGKRLRKLGVGDFRSYLDWVRGDGGEEEMVQLIDAISTNVTGFFREPAHFDFLSEVMTGWIREGQRRFRFWSAASSTGEEPYTLAMTLAELEPPGGWDTRILATDISTRVLAAAREGVYAASKTAGLPAGALRKWFEPAVDPQTHGEAWRVSPALRNLISYSRLNLSQPPFPMQGPMDAIFCRNVMIYFDQPVRDRLVREFHRLLKPGGYLLVGHSESLAGLTAPFKTVRPSVYVKAK